MASTLLNEFGLLDTKFYPSPPSHHQQQHYLDEEDKEISLHHFLATTHGRSTAVLGHSSTINYDYYNNNNSSSGGISGGEVFRNFGEHLPLHHDNGCAGADFGKRKAGEATFEDYFESNNDAIFAFKGKDFICLANDSRFTNQSSSQIYSSNHNKVHSMSDGKVLLIFDHFKSDADYLLRYCRLKNQNYYFDNNRYMNAKQMHHLIAHICFERSSKLMIYCNALIIGFEEEIDECGLKKPVPKIYTESVTGSFGEEFSNSLGSSTDYVQTALDSFIGNSSHCARNRALVDEEQAVSIAKSILKNVSAKEISTGGIGTVTIFKADGVARVEKFDLKKD